MVMAVPEKVREAIIANIPVGRLGTTDEVARVVTFLANDTAGYITGSNISVNGGQHMF
jgi:acetoacetyl-CoA reductase